MGRERQRLPRELALRFEQAGEYGKAIHYLEHAGKNAIQRNAYQEAIQHLTKALALLRTLASTPERSRQELMLQITLGSTLQAANGYAASEVEQAYARARSLSQQGEDNISFPALIGLHRFYVLRGEFSVGYDLAKQCLALAQREQDPALLVEAHYIMGAILMILGEIPAAWNHIEQGSTLYNLQHHRTHAIQYGHDPGVAHLSHASWILWMLGYPDRALQQSTEALALARKLEHVNSLAYALWFAAELHIMRREGDKTQEHGEALVAVATEYSLPLWLANGIIVHGWILTEQGQFEAGLTQMNKGLATTRVLGAQLRQPQYLTHLIEGYAKSGRTEEGQKALAEGLVTVNNTGERYSEAELYRLKGTLTLEARGWRPETSSTSPQASSLQPQVSSEVAEEAEECFRKAIDIARQQSAKSWELRATMSLARLWQQQGKRHEAHQMLSDIYNWFTEGFGTAGLKNAKALLEALGN